MNYFTGPTTLRVCAAGGRILSALLAFVILIPVAAGAQALPTGWTGSDVGSPALSGRATYNAGTFTVEGAGKRVGFSSDQFYFVYQRLTGDATIVARVESIENTASSAKAGVMIRESLAANSRHAFSLVTPLSGIGFHRRRVTGKGTSGTNLGGFAPVWLKLVRSGSTFTASYSTNGSVWTSIGTDTISMASTVYVGLAVSSYNTSALATGVFNNVSVTTPGSTPPPPPPSGLLPSGWTNGDVGGPALSGVSAYSNGGFSITGSGQDIWSIADQFQYAYRQVSGDVDVIARVASFQGPSGWSKAGVMIRATMATDSAHTSMFVTPSNGLAFQRRPTAGYWSLHTNAGPGAAPTWVKLERRGTAVTGFRSNDGVNWTMIGSQALSLPATFYVGLAVTSNNTGARATAQFTNVTVVSASGTVSNTPPTVSLTAPTAGATFTAPATVSVSANAADTDNGVAQVEFYANGTLIGTDATSPYAYTWSGVAAGNYTVTAVARDTVGATATSGGRSITVSAPSGGSNPPPTVSITAPAGGASYTAPASVTISANASDANGIARVDFYAGSTLVGSDTSSPYGVTWANAPAGSFPLTAIARDTLGATTTSAAVGIVINNPPIPKRAVFTPSTDHAIVTRYVLDIFTAGANPSTATPVATKDLGKPSVVNGVCDVDVSATTTALPGGNYFATVVAISSGGTSTRAVSPTFAR